MPKVSHKEMRHIEPLRFGRPAFDGWEPAALPELHSGEPISIDFEYDPHDDPTRCKPFSFAIYRPGVKQGYYAPWAHEGGGNIDKAVAMRWLTDNLRGRHIYGLNTKAELHSLFNLDIDPNELDVHPHDIAFPPTLLKEDRYKGFSLEALSEEYLPPDERKVHPDMDPRNFKLMHAAELAPRCCSDAYLAWRIHEVTRPQVVAQGLERVNEVEDNCILPVVGMERTGFLIDRPKLERWLVEIDQRIERKFNYVHKETGVGLVTDSSKAWDRIFALRGHKKPIIFNEKTTSWEETYSAEGLKTVAFVGGKLENGIADPVVAAAFDIRRMRSLKSKFFDKYIQAIDSSNILRFPLHQLRSTNEFGSDDDSGFGAVTGRFSCGGNEHKVNAQQVYKAEKQLEELGPDFIVRELMIAAFGKKMGASDASQIEFRFFSHYAAVLGHPKTALAYAKDPMVDFHLLATMLMNPTITDKAKLKALRKHMKHNNFGVLYGMGRPKLARRLGLGCTCEVDWKEMQWDERRGCERKVRYFGQNKFHNENCPARKANDIMDEYDLEFPEARELLKAASDRARKVGFVKDILGRRRRYPDGQRLHSSLNSVIQPSAATYFKMKLYELHRERKTLQINLRAPVHDEFVYDIDPDPVYAKRTQELLDTQSIKLRVPLLWESGFGNNWREANGK